MAWWPRAFGWTALSSGLEYRVALELYSQDGKRCSEVRKRRDGKAYFVDLECVDGAAFRIRGRGEEIGPFESPAAARAAAVCRPWFHHGEESD